MRLILYTSKESLKDELFLYMYAHLSAIGLDTHVVATTPKDSCATRWRRKIRKFRGMGLAHSLEIVTSLPLQAFFSHRDRDATLAFLRALPRPPLSSDASKLHYAAGPNSAAAANLLKELRPDIMIQAGAGILRHQIFSIPRLGTLNLHHGIAPAIRGMNSIYWALWENRPDWLGSTVHFIDDGIDTGAPLAYARISQWTPQEGFPRLFARASEAGVKALVQTVQSLAAGLKIIPPGYPGPGEYRSTFSGWKMLLLELRSKKRLLEPRAEQ